MTRDKLKQALIPFYNILKTAHIHNINVGEWIMSEQTHLLLSSFGFKELFNLQMKIDTTIKTNVVYLTDLNRNIVGFVRMRTDK